MEDVQITEAPEYAGPSLADRMRRRAETIATQRTVVLPVPGYQSMLGVTMRALSLEHTSRIATQNKKVRIEATRNLYIAADIVIAATEGFVEFKEDGTETELGHEFTWQSLAQEVRDIEPRSTARQSMFALLGDIGVASLASDYDEWLGAEKVEMEEEVVEDFASTP